MSEDYTIEILFFAAVAFVLLVTGAALFGSFVGRFRARAAVVAGMVTPAVLFMVYYVFLHVTEPEKGSRFWIGVVVAFIPFVALLVLGLALGFVRRPSHLGMRYLLGLGLGMLACLLMKLA